LAAPGPQTHHVEVRAADHAGAHDTRLAETDHGEHRALAPMPSARVTMTVSASPLARVKEAAQLTCQAVLEQNR
jgi:hypothetical protein